MTPLPETIHDFYLGCAIWAYKGWLGDFFPPGSSASEFLKLYAQRFTAVEVNATFYSTPKPETVQRWAAQTPETFQFCPKFPQAVTHNGPLQPRIETAIAFIQLMQGLGPRLGPIFAQLPPSYGPQNFSDLTTFLNAIQTTVPLALEVRHPQWFQSPHADRLNDLLASLQIGRVLLDPRPIYQGSDDPQAQSQRRKPKLPLHPIITAPFTVIRYISHPQRALNDTFLCDWVQTLQTWLDQGTRTYFFVHCPIEEKSPRTAQAFQHRLQDHVPIPGLPWDQLAEPPQQLNLF
ncbi:DUF72 domain-containing protein [Acaryochloris sp. IP29b_bin.148]|uniref:DUF72 domain-containing protein n=1 Tax=Acaryochloris sp. IP29b_bin.148 TaxID=2969218 RepID=UPI00260BBBC0|nr:DUF72 domain-containing protein [Acaryochloris sp. IP29b_bin.148]